MSFFFFNDTATTEIYTLSLHDALPISSASPFRKAAEQSFGSYDTWKAEFTRSEEHTSELQSHLNLVCRLLLEKKKICQRAMSKHCASRHMPPVALMSVLK